MRYESRLLPIDEAGGFLLAVHFGQSIGGENTREAAHARFAVGQAIKPETLREIGQSCTLPRPSSAGEAEQMRQMAAIQGELSRNPEYGSAMREQYALNEASFLHAAALALCDTVHVPRRVSTSRRGHALLGFDVAARGDLSPLHGHVRLVDLASGRVQLDERSRHVRHSRFLALSFDGTRALAYVPRGEAMVVAEHALEAGLPELEPLATERCLKWLSFAEGWIGIGEDRIAWFAQGAATPFREVRVQSGFNAWDARASIDGLRIAWPGERGAVVLVDAQSGSLRRFHPHRGLKRGTLHTVSVSDCGQWLASRAGEDLSVTRLTDGVSWRVATLRDMDRRDASGGGHVVESHVPAAFGFIGSRLLAAEVERTMEIALDEPSPADGAFISELGRKGARKPIHVPAQATFERMMKSARLEAASSALLPHFSPAVLLRTRALGKSGWLAPGKGKAPALGTSRFGGWPDLPPDVAWPEWQGRPMAFLGQVNLEEARAAQPALRLPGRGLLAFFLGCQGETYEREEDPRPRYFADVMAGAEPDKRGAWQVLYVEEPSHLERRMRSDSPLPELFEPCAIRYAKGGKPLPDESTASYDGLGLSEGDLDRYNELLAQLVPDDEEGVEQLMGHANLIQGTPPEVMCELASRGTSPWLHPQVDDPEYAPIISGAAEWGLLLQLTSNVDARFLWGDGGHFYFYGKRDAMERGVFSGVWVVFEN